MTRIQIDIDNYYDVLNILDKIKNILRAMRYDELQSVSRLSVCAKTSEDFRVEVAGDIIINCLNIYYKDGHHISLPLWTV